MKLITIALRTIKASAGGLFFISIFSILSSDPAFGQQPIETNNELKLEAERLWSSIDIGQLKNEIAAEAKVSKADVNLFFRYLEPQWGKDKVICFRKVLNGEITSSNFGEYLSDLKSRYVSLYASFALVKTEYANEISAIENHVMDATGKCVNMDFEDGNFNGWQGQVQSRGGLGGTGTIVTRPGFGQHCIMTKTQKDPYVPNLSVVAPGGNYSVRLGNTEAGGHLAKMTQSFKVDTNNAILTYRYAVVLETPTNDPNHQGLDSPHFQTRLYDKDGNEITCGEYTVSVLGSNLSSYTHICVNANSEEVQITSNSGCGNTTTLPATSVSNPNANNQCGNNRMDLYYRNWTTVAIALKDYIGQTVTVEFVASDCEPGGHLGYAYIDTQCSSITSPQSSTICSFKETKVLTGPAGFKSYEWGPAGSFQGPATNQSVTIDRAGVYTLKVMTVSDNPCVVTLTYTVKDKCTPRAYKDSLCETVKGSGKADEVDLNFYNSKVTEAGAWGTVQSWHSQRPTPADSHVMPSVTGITISDGDVYYAVTVLPNRKDTVSITFNVNSLPDITFPDINPVCVGSPAFKIPGILPAGGVFSGTGINATGTFTPSTVGSFDLKYTFTDKNTCKFFVTKPIVVEPKPTAEAGPPQVLCENASTINLSGSVTNATSGSWKGGAGGGFSPNGLTSSYTITDADRNTGSVLFTLTSSTGICPPATDQVLVTFEKMPVANAGSPQSFCENTPSVTLSGKVTNVLSGIWEGGIGTFQPDRITLNATYIPHASEVSAGTVKLTLKTKGQDKCPLNQSDVTFTYEKLPTVDAGTGSLLCENATNIKLNGTYTNAIGILWYGGSQSFNDPTKTDAVYSIYTKDKTLDSLLISIKTTGNILCPPAIDTVIYHFERLPVVNAGTGSTLCESNPVIKLSGTSSNSPGVIWEGGTASGFVSPLSLSTDYIPTATEINDGAIAFILSSTGTKVCPESQSIVVFNFEKMPEINAGPDISVCANNINIPLKADVKNITGGIWNGGEGSYDPSVKNLEIIYHPTKAEIESGKINLAISSEGSKVCPPVTDTVQILITPAPTVDAGPDDTVCIGLPQVQLSGVSSTGSAIWTGDGTFGAGASSLEYTPSDNELASGKAMLILTSDQNGNCLPVSDTMEIKIEPLPSVDLGEDLVGCYGSELSITAVNTTKLKYIWEESGSLLPDTLGTISVSVKDEKVTYVVKGKDRLGCDATDSIDVIGIPEPKVSLSDTAVCLGNLVTLDSKPLNIDNNVSLNPFFTWYKDGINLNANNSQILSVSEPGLYSVTASLGACTGTAQARVNIYPLPAGALPDKIKHCFETGKDLELNAGTGKYYLWNPSGETTQKILVTMPGTYSVEITNEFNCTGIDKVEVDAVCPPRLFISNSFSPNADAVNDLYDVFGAHIGKFRMLIFNRWGEVIFESNDRYVFWDGIYKGEPMVEGVYPWTIVYEGDSEEYKGPYTMTGSVTVVR
ncbi:MAG: gliding motility-associated C-terminal domain-containing protein [Sporocytophaga sp.]|uniref:T9SS type B sorting domain-containing protein n=1 Tax=Sporocytophaga sp. TaxID=2231183 RepID=UPI001AFCF70D|nr:gliding motility-associated C-terminal domain-containing protein [Sporocytophaga sp.]MBO9700919.1 gliding motility-associated C-terminal domain-containing protein [Sporocytophaga sp.]